MNKLSQTEKQHWYRITKYQKRWHAWEYQCHIPDHLELENTQQNVVPNDASNPIGVATIKKKCFQMHFWMRRPWFEAWNFNVIRPFIIALFEKGCQNPNLNHDGINPRKSCLTISPSLQKFIIVLPRNLQIVIRNFRTTFIMINN
jgi:hypothetical protein